MTRDEKTFDFPVPVANSANAEQKELMLFKLDQSSSLK